MVDCMGLVMIEVGALDATGIFNTHHINYVMDEGLLSLTHLQYDAWCFVSVPASPLGA